MVVWSCCRVFAECVLIVGVWVGDNVLACGARSAAGLSVVGGCWRFGVGVSVDDRVLVRSRLLVRGVLIVVWLFLPCFLNSEERCGSLRLPGAAVPPKSKSGRRGSIP